jgi:hypothetical protein
MNLIGDRDKKVHSLVGLESAEEEDRLRLPARVLSVPAKEIDGAVRLYGDTFGSFCLLQKQLSAKRTVNDKVPGAVIRKRFRSLFRP